MTTKYVWQTLRQILKRSMLISAKFAFSITDVAELASVPSIIAVDMQLNSQALWASLQ